jgi:hypothetical protein
MKNIHVLPTNKPNRLGRFIDTNNLFLRTTNDIPRGENINIYITSDEEIKEGDWAIATEGIWKNTIIKITGTPITDVWRKIILTTDIRLAPDVQKIDDEFLEWFVKNPSCEEVVVIYEPKNFFDVKKGWEYKIIIPKEEPDYTALLKPVGTRQETLEEAIDKTREEYPFWFNKESFELGAKWQQERSYSEEDMIDFAHFYFTEEFNSSMQTSKSTKDIFNEWFEQFKKK